MSSMPSGSTRRTPTAAPGLARRRAVARLLPAGLVALAVLTACTSEPARRPAPAPPDKDDGGLQVGSEVVFEGDYETGDFTQWTRCQNRKYSDPCADYDGDFYGARIDDQEVRQGDYAARFEVRNGDDPSWGGGERSEVSRYEEAIVREGDERWYEFSLKFDEDFPDVEGNFFIVMQWHAGDDSSPPMALEVDRKGRLVLADNTSDDAEDVVIGDIVRGEWVDYVIHATFSRDAEEGWAEVWQDGELVVERHARANMTTERNYLKMGIYRAKQERSTAIVWQDGLRITAP
ncbi:polysaccharide lyase [Geodermatophilus sp. YIM 151500]|uniref:polysaccharide lyase n=1 Tax=Geodermatophilus sp. YIM 151500 TaxID=2984531 RepID=UPI0021E38308|nr:polysaccharide lyase [Geodermatophilus sp. YIM 151500]MCV2491519.1 polysaccharide lyase [Geodermatophilus sp. YIM 151500]